MSYKYTCSYAALFYSPCISLQAHNSGSKRLLRSLTCIFCFTYTITIQLYMLTQHSSDKGNNRHVWTSWHIITWLPYKMGTVTLYILILFTARPCNGSMTALLYPNEQHININEHHTCKFCHYVYTVNNKPEFLIKLMYERTSCFTTAEQQHVCV